MATPTPSLPFKTVLIANRGEVALRLIRAVHSLNLRAVAVFVSADSSSPHLVPADLVHSLGDDPSSYANPTQILAAAKATQSEAILPGYGFLSEDPAAAALFESNALVWIGPTSDTLSLFGLKHTARTAALAAGVPTVPGSPVLDSPDHALREADAVGFPALLKASAGGGGMGQAVVRGPGALRRQFHVVAAQADALFSSCDIYLERYVENARHVEVQVFGDGAGHCVVLGDRECSVQRRRQKVLEEGSAPNLPDEVRVSLRSAAAQLCAKHMYRSAGTVEFIVDADTLEWFFLEVNTRLQVEHGVTELVSGVDIVRWMLLQAGGVDVLQGGKVPLKETGFAIEARIYAENPVKDYAPCPGTLSEMVWPKETVCADSGSRIRVDAWAQRGTVVPGHYDPLLGKVLSWGRTRPLAILEMKKALRQTKVSGVPSNVELLLQVTDHPDFIRGEYTTSLLKAFSPRTRSIEVVRPGLQSSLQDYPGRVGYWSIGVSPSGPMDAYAMGMANALVGNSLSSCALEMTMKGPTLTFHMDAVIALTGGYFQAELEDGRTIQFWTPFKIKAGSTLTIGRAETGKVAYLAVRGGFNVPKYLGSASTFPTGKFGGLHGSFLVTGDFLPICDVSDNSLDEAEHNGLLFRWALNNMLPSEFIPRYGDGDWTVAALNGPHASSDFLQDETLGALWNTSYLFHHAKNRLGARLIGPTPKWTRADGGSAGLHPSNLHDYTYAPGAVNFSGNTPIVLMLDGPSLGGFVCPITVATSDLWKVAQAKPGEKLNFKQVDCDDANNAFFAMERAWRAVRYNDTTELDRIAATWSPHWVSRCKAKKLSAILASLDPRNGDSAEIKVAYRRSGDEHVLIEYGDIGLQLAYRLRVHMLMKELESKPYIKELCPGVRSLLVRYDRRTINVKDLISVLTELESGVLGSVEDVVVESRLLKLPLAFDDQWTKEAQSRYLRSVRPDAPYMPSNVEFVRRINGLSTVNDVEEIMNNAEYMVLGLGDVYLGAPCAVPVDPRHRIVTSKYNPARTYTPEGAVGIGGAYMCIYGMDSPGGYQLTGRTLPIWDSYGSISEENRGAPQHVPWLLRFFDRVKFFSVSDEELEHLRLEYRKGHYKIEILKETFNFRDHLKFCETNKESIEQFEKRREAAYDAERARWEAEGEGESSAAAEHATGNSTRDLRQDSGTLDIIDDGRPPFSISVPAGMAANVWAVHKSNGDLVQKGEYLFSLESMKVEIDIEAPESGTVQGIHVKKGDIVSPDEELCIVVSSEDLTLGDARIGHLKGLYKLGIVRPGQVIKHAIKVADETGSIFSSLCSLEDIESRITEIEASKHKRLHAPLYGVPFVVSVDMEVDEYLNSSSGVVNALSNAGAILIGKTKTDQLTLNNPLYPGIVTGGNGAAAIAVQKQIASFAIVIDRHGTSTVAPALCGVFGLKTTEGLLPPRQARTPYESFDCLGIYGNNAADIKRVFDCCMAARTTALPSCRPIPAGDYDLPKCLFRGMKLSYFDSDSLKRALEGDTPTEEAYEKAVERLHRIGYNLQAQDLSSFLEASELFDKVPLQYATLGSLLPKAGIPTSSIPCIAKPTDVSDKLSGSRVASAMIILQNLKRHTQNSVWAHADAAILPILTKSCSVDEATKDANAVNDALSRFSRLLTAMDLCSVTLHLPSIRPVAKPRGICIVAPAFREGLLLALAAKW